MSLHFLPAIALCMCILVISCGITAGPKTQQLYTTVNITISGSQDPGVRNPGTTELGGSESDLEQGCSQAVSQLLSGSSRGYLCAFRYQILTGWWPEASMPCHVGIPTGPLTHDSVVPLSCGASDPREIDKQKVQDFRRLGGKESTCQCRRHGFDPG